MSSKEPVNVFYACDANYAPCLSVSLLSLVENRDENREYRVTVLESGMSEEIRERLLSAVPAGVKLSFSDISGSLRRVAGRLALRDYYSLSIYYRIFIPDVFRELDRAVYVDADTVVLDDIGKLYDTRLYGNLMAAVPDAVIASEDVFRRYAEEGVGVPDYRLYFNSGVLVMDLDAMRRENISGTFLSLLTRYGFETICPDQDYLNVICEGKVRLLGTAWNRMTVDARRGPKPKLIHYNMFFKPWNYPQVRYADVFREYAARSPFAAEIEASGKAFGKAGVRRDGEAGVRLRESAERIIRSDRNFRRVLKAEEEYSGGLYGEETETARA